jgi:hypothetical protein
VSRICETTGAKVHLARMCRTCYAIPPQADTILTHKCRDEVDKVVDGTERIDGHLTMRDGWLYGDQSELGWHEIGAALRYQDLLLLAAAVPR